MHIHTLSLSLSFYVCMYMYLNTRLFTQRVGGDGISEDEDKIASVRILFQRCEQTQAVYNQAYIRAMVILCKLVLIIFENPIEKCIPIYRYLHTYRKWNKMESIYLIRLTFNSLHHTYIHTCIHTYIHTLQFIDFQHYNGKIYDRIHIQVHTHTSFYVY